MNPEEPRKTPPPLFEDNSQVPGAGGADPRPSPLPPPLPPSGSRPLPGASPLRGPQQETPRAPGIAGASPAGAEALDAAAFAPPARKKRGPLFYILICGGALLAAIASLVGFVLMMELTASDITLTQSQKNQLFTTRDFARWHGEWTPTGGKEIYSGRKYFDGSLELEYEFNDESDGDAPYIYTMVSIERNTTDARSTYAGQKVGEGFGSWWEGEDLASEGIEIVERKGIFSWGDDSSYSIYKTEEGEAYGAQFMARRGKHVVMLIISGDINPEDGKRMSELLRPALNRLK